MILEPIDAVLQSGKLLQRKEKMIILLRTRQDYDETDEPVHVMNVKPVYCVL